MDGVDVVLPMESVKVAQSRFANTLFGYFLGKRQAYPVVESFVKNAWAKHGLQRIMMNSNGFFFFKFSSRDGMQQVLETGPWLIRNVPIFLNIWSPTTLLKKEDIKAVAVWVKIHNVPIAAYTEDGISLLATKIGTPKLLDSYTADMCVESWGRSSYARALVEISADREFKDELTLAIPNLEGEGYVKESLKIEYEWKPPRCEHCAVFGHDGDQCPKLVTSTQKPTPCADGFQVVQKKKKVKMVYRPISKPTTHTGGASTSKASVGSKNSYELLSDHDEESVFVDSGKKEWKESGLSGGYKTYQSGPAKAHQLVDEFDDDIDEHIELPKDA